jgi:hypothetical protein
MEPLDITDKSLSLTRDEDEEYEEDLSDGEEMQEEYSGLIDFVSDIPLRS